MKTKITYLEISDKVYPVTEPESVHKVMLDICDDLSECLVLFTLGSSADSRISVIAKGFTNKIQTSPAEIFRRAFTTHPTVTRIILAHNHPSGEKEPSDEDLSFTRRMKEACKTVGIELCDHVISTRENGFYSFSRENII